MEKAVEPGSKTCLLEYDHIIQCLEERVIYTHAITFSKDLRMAFSSNMPEIVENIKKQIKKIVADWNRSIKKEGCPWRFEMGYDKKKKLVGLNGVGREPFAPPLTKSWVFKWKEDQK